MGHMQRRGQWLYQSIAFLVLLALGVWVRCARLNDPMPLPEEAPQVLTAACVAETLSAVGWPQESVAPRTLFHGGMGACARFMGEGRRSLHLRCYRAFPLVAGVLFLPLVLALGVQRRGGVFATSDGPLWAMAMAAASPALIWSSGYLGPWGGQALLFLGIVVAARSYAQWPSLFAAVAMGVLWALLGAVAPPAVWLPVLLFPAVLLGVGWSRFCLYWRTLHVAVACSVGVGLWVLLRYLGWAEGAMLPTLPKWSPAELLEPLWWLRWGVMPVLGLVASIGLALWGFRGGDRRWARTLSVTFGVLLLGAPFFCAGGAFVAPLMALVPIVLGVGISVVARPWARWTLGNGALILVCVATAGMTWLAPTWRLPRAEQKQTFATLSAACDAPKAKPYRVSVVGADAAACAALVWPLRAEARRVALSAHGVPVEADIVIVHEGSLGRLPAKIGKTVRPGRACLEPEQAYRVFAARPVEP